MGSKGKQTDVIKSKQHLLVTNNYIHSSNTYVHINTVVVNGPAHQRRASSQLEAPHIYHGACGCVSKTAINRLVVKYSQETRFIKFIAHLQVLSTVYRKHSEIGISISGYFYYPKSPSSPFFSNPTVSLKDSLKTNVTELCYRVQFKQKKKKFQNRKTVKFFTLTSTKKKNLNFFSSNLHSSVLR